MKNELKNFPNMSDELLKNGGTFNDSYHKKIIILCSEFERRFQEFTRMEPVVTFMT
jgi:hypothetical protein